MGNYIVIGLVDDIKEQEKFKISCVKFANRFKNKIKSIKLRYPVDSFCENYGNENLEKDEINKVIQKCLSNESAKGYIEIEINGKNYNFIVEVEVFEHDSICLYFSILEEELKMGENIDIVESKIIEELKFAIKCGFIYAYCDNETYVDNKIEEVINYDDIYSICVINDNDSILVKKASWKINGIEERNNKR